MESKLYKTNASGHAGVSWSKAHKRWKAYIYVDDKQIWLGEFVNKDDAIAARKDSELKYAYKRQGLTKQYMKIRIAELEAEVERLNGLLLDNIEADHDN